MDILSRITFLPLIAAVLVAFMPAHSHRTIKWFTFLATMTVFLLSMGLVRQFDAIPAMQMTVHKAWLPSLVFNGEAMVSSSADMPSASLMSNG